MISHVATASTEQFWLLCFFVQIRFTLNIQVHRKML